MKLHLILPFFSSTVAFQVASPLVKSTTSSSLYASTESVDVKLAKYEVLETARRLKSENGVLVIDSISQEELKQAVETLELLATPSTDVDELVGEWTLVCSTASASPSGPLENLPDFPKLPFMNQGPLAIIRDLLNKSFQVQQSIKTNASGDIDRIDHVLEYNPPNKLADFLDNIPDALTKLNINPLQVSKSKVILVHKAQVESVLPVIKTKLNLSSIIVNLAGESKILDPEGADILGINVPLGEFLNAGSFDTTFMDREIRISRSKVGMVDQLRVFVRAGDTMDKAEEEGEDLFYETAMSQEYMDKIAIDSEPSDVESPKPEPEVTDSDAPMDEIAMDSEISDVEPLEPEPEVTDGDAMDEIAMDSEISDVEPPEPESEATDGDAPSDVKSESEEESGGGQKRKKKKKKKDDGSAPSDVKDDLQA